MTHINLLPWREQLREERKNQFFVGLAVSACLALFIAVSVHIAFRNIIHRQETRNQYLQTEIQYLDKKIAKIKELKKRKSALIARMTIIQELQADRSQVVKLFAEIVNILPSGIVLSKINRKNNIIAFEGDAESNSNVSTLMRNIDKANELTHAVLSEIKTQDKEGKRHSQFKLQLTLVKPATTHMETQ